VLTNEMNPSFGIFLRVTLDKMWYFWQKNVKPRENNHFSWSHPRNRRCLWKGLRPCIISVVPILPITIAFHRRKYRCSPAAARGAPRGLSGRDPFAKSNVSRLGICVAHPGMTSHPGSVSSRMRSRPASLENHPSLFPTDGRVRVRRKIWKQD